MSSYTTSSHMASAACTSGWARRAGSHGFTLIELMVVIVVFAILLTIALPAFDTLIKNTRLATASSEVQTVFGLARAEAVTRRRSVSVCPSSTGTDCTGTADWKSGLIVFTNAAADGEVGVSDQVLKYLQLSGAVQINAAGADLATATFIRFTPTGIASVTGSLTFCDTRPAGNYGRRLQLFQVGRVEATRNQTCP